MYTPKKPWTTAEKVLLRAEYPTKNAQEMLSRLPGRTIPAIKDQARALGIEKAGTRFKKPTEPVAGRAHTNAADRFNLGKSNGPKGGLTDYLRLEASKEEKAAYLRATPVGSKAGTAPRTVAQLHAFMQQPR